MRSARRSRERVSFWGFDGLHFHDLRHDGVSRLFEMGSTISQAANVSGQRSWSSLKRYDHPRQTGDKYAGRRGWKWSRRLEPLFGGLAHMNRPCSPVGVLPICEQCTYTKTK
jgi:hypothetical protein